MKNDVTDYSSKDIKVLENLEAVRNNVGMFIGSTDNPGHLLVEVYGNALDEVKNGFASAIGIEISEETNIIRVADNGRGIPFDNDVISTLVTKLFSGAKNKSIDTSVKKYKKTIGLHGVGLVAVNALSEWMEINIYRDGLHAVFTFEKGVCVKEDIQPHPATSKKPFSTMVSFKPDKKYFDKLTMNVDKLRRQMNLAVACLPSHKCLFSINGQQSIISKNIQDYFTDGVVDKKESCTKIYHFSYTDTVTDESVECFFCWEFDGNVTPRSIGSINLLNVDSGTHVNSLNEIIRNTLFKIATGQKRKTLKAGDINVWLRSFCLLDINEASYDSQTKENFCVPKSKMTNLFPHLEKQILQYFETNPDECDILFNRIEAFRKRQDKRVAVSSSATNYRFSTNADSKLKECDSTDSRQCELFLVEGDSAAGSASSCRNVIYQAIMPLKGKPISVAGKGTAAAYKNAEIIEIIRALGTDTEKDYDGSKLRYHKIIIASDADADGSHIRSLLITNFLCLTPEIIKGGYLYKAVMPLYGSRNKQNEFVPLWSDQELQQFKRDNPRSSITRFKGLGEMDPDELYTCLMNPNTRRLEKILFPTNVSAIMDLMTNADDKRTLITSSED